MDSEERDERNRKGFNERGEVLYKPLNRDKENSFIFRIYSSRDKKHEEDSEKVKHSSEDDIQLSLFTPFD